MSGSNHRWRGFISAVWSCDNSLSNHCQRTKTAIYNLQACNYTKTCEACKACQATHYIHHITTGAFKTEAHEGIAVRSSQPSGILNPVVAYVCHVKDTGEVHKKQREGYLLRYPYGNPTARFASYAISRCRRVLVGGRFKPSFRIGLFRMPARYLKYSRVMKGFKL
jgi:hypothetical protein